MPAPRRASEVKWLLRRSSKEPRSHKTQFQWAKTAVGPGGDGFSVFGPHWHSIVESQNKSSGATHKTIAISWRRNNRMESAERTTPTYHVENTMTPRWASSGTTQPHGTSSLPHCSGDNCVTFTQSTREWGEEAAVRFTAPYLCAAEITCVCGDNVAEMPRTLQHQQSHTTWALPRWHPLRHARPQPPLRTSRTAKGEGAPGETTCYIEVRPPINQCTRETQRPAVRRSEGAQATLALVEHWLVCSKLSSHRVSEISVPISFSHFVFIRVEFTGVIDCKESYRWDIDFSEQNMGQRYLSRQEPVKASTFCRCVLT